MRPASADLLLFDLDGTLVDSFADIRAGIEHALASIDVEPAEDLLALSRRGVALEVFYQRGTGRDAAAATEQARLQRFVDAYRSYYVTHQDQTRPFTGVRETLEWIRAQRPNLRLAVATTKRTDMARAVTDRLGLSALFDWVQGSDGLPKKPDPALLALVASRAGVGVDAAVMVGDTDGDVLAARAAGCASVAVTYGGWSRAELEPLAPDYLIDRFAELRGLLVARE